MATTVRVPIDFRNPQVSANQGNCYFNVRSLTDWNAGIWEFVLDVDGKLYGLVAVPSDLAATPAASVVLAIAANATTGNTRLVVGTSAIADGESFNPGSLTDETAQDVTVPATAYLRKDVSFTLTNAPAADDVLIVEVYHAGAHANDTLATNTLLFEGWLECDIE